MMPSRLLLLSTAHLIMLFTFLFLFFTLKIITNRKNETPTLNVVFEESPVYKGLLRIEGLTPFRSCFNHKFIHALVEIFQYFNHAPIHIFPWCWVLEWWIVECHPILPSSQVSDLYQISIDSDAIIHIAKILI